MKTFAILSLIVTSCVLTNVSCKKALGPDFKYYVPEPSNIQVVAKESTVTLHWDYNEDPRIVKFVSQLSLDKSFVSIFKSDTVDASQRTSVFNNVSLVTAYYTRVRAIANDIVISSNFASKALELESIFQSPIRAEVQSTSVTLRWNAPSTGTVTSIVLIPVGAASLPAINLTPAQVTARAAKVDGLIGSTQYTALIYDGELRKGIVTFTTRDVNEKIYINSNTATLYETLQNAVDAAASGDIINIGAAKYDFSSTANETITITGKSLTFQAAPGAASKPELTFKNFALIGNIANIKIAGIKIISTSNLISTGSNTDYNKHIFAGTLLTGNTNIEVDNCDLSGAMSGLLFTQTTGTGGATGTATIHLSINNSLLHDFGNAGGDFIDFRSGAVGNITFKNSSFWNGARAFFRVDATATILGGSKVTIENSTFYNFCNGGIFLRVAAAGADINLNKNIIMNKVSNNGNSIGGTGTTLKLNTNNISGTNAANITAGVTSGFNIGTTALDPQFTAVATGNFTVGNATLKTAALGDPRWLQ